MSETTSAEEQLRTFLSGLSKKNRISDFSLEDDQEYDDIDKDFCLHTVTPALNARMTNEELAETFLVTFFFNVDKKTGQLLVYKDSEGIYVDQAESLIKDRLERSIPGISKNRKAEILAKIKDRLAMKAVDFDNYPDWLHCNNGWIDVMNGKFNPHSPDILSLRKLPVDYKAGATCPEILKFLESTLDHEQMAIVLRMVAYCLLRSSKYETAFILNGEGANGKSTLINVIKSLLGKENCSAVSLQDIAWNKFSAAELHGKMVNLHPDLKADKIKDGGYFKALVSGDRIKVERKYGQPFELENTAKLIFSANEIPETDDNSYAYFRRWVIVPFNRTFEGENRDTNLLAKLTTPEELSGLLYWTLIMLRQLMRENGFQHSDIEEVRKQYQLGASKIQDFIKECCVLGEGESVRTADLNNALANYCKSKGTSFVDIRELGKRLASLGIEHKKKRVKGESFWFYFGVGLKEGVPVYQTNQVPFSDFSKVVQDSAEMTGTTGTESQEVDQLG